MFHIQKMLDHLNIDLPGLCFELWDENYCDYDNSLKVKSIKCALQDDRSQLSIGTLMRCTKQGSMY